MALSKVDLANQVENDLPQSLIANNVPFRNIIINGDMIIAQRGTSQSSITSDGYYTVDRFATETNSSSVWTQSQASDAPSGQGFTYSLKMDCTTAQASPASNDVLLIGQSIEGSMLQAIKQGTANAQSTTLSFWHKHTKTGTNIVELLDADNNNAVSGSYTQSVSDTWEKATITFPANTSGTYDNDQNRSLRIRFIMSAGSDTTSGTLATTWQTTITNADRYAGQVNNADSTSNNFIITGVQYEAGTSASDFEFLPHDTNALRCNRYFQRYTSSFWILIQRVSDNTRNANFILNPEMRATPTFTATSSSEIGNTSVQDSSSKIVSFQHSGSADGRPRYTDFNFSAEL
jgi:hypothetical protein